MITFYEKTFPLTSSGGIMSFALPTDAPALEINQECHWIVEVLCNFDDGEQGGNISIEEAVKRVIPKETIVQLSNVSISDRLIIYAKAGYWYDTLLLMLLFNCEQLIIMTQLSRKIG